MKKTTHCQSGNVLNVNGGVVKMKGWKIVKWFLFTICVGLFILAGLYSPVFLLGLEEITNIQPKCEGIELYYKGRGFSSDFILMKFYYDRCYSNDPKFALSNIIVKSPDKICRDVGFDCEDFTNAVICLCNLYNQSCKRYIETSASLVKIRAHSGIYWLNEAEDRWVMIS